MASIDGNACDVFRGVIVPPQRQGRRVERFGVANIGHIAGALIPQTSQVQTVHYAADVAASTALRGTLAAVAYDDAVTVVDGLGQSWTNCIVEGVTFSEARRVLVNESQRIMLVADWEICATELPSPPPPPE